MKRKLGGLRDSVVNAALGVNLRANVGAFQGLLDRADARAEEHREQVEVAAAGRGRIEHELRKISNGLVRQQLLLRALRDDIPGLQRQLEAIRSDPEHARAIHQDDPLVTIRIAAFQNTDALMNVALPSALAQSYENFEVVIVNDGPNAQTRTALEDLADPHVRYVEFATRNSYPEDSHSRWMVAGSPGMNRGADLARGTWIAPLDDDDEFTGDHVEKLVSLARAEGVELAYGALTQRNVVNGDQNHIFSSPPAISQFSFQGAIYLSRLHPVFRYDEQSWLVEEPGDWNLIRRMSAAGVTMAATSDVVAIMNHIPYTHKDGE